MLSLPPVKPMEATFENINSTTINVVTFQLLEEELCWIDRDRCGHKNEFIHRSAKLAQRKANERMAENQMG